MSFRLSLLGLAAAVVLGATPALAGDSDWQTVLTSPYLIKTRARTGSPVKEVWAEGPMDAPVQDIQAALMDPERFPNFMPYVKEARLLGQAEPDGSRFVYTRLELPIVAARDYVLHVHLDQGTAADGSGEFRNHWSAADKVPARSHVVRLKVNDGSWHVTPAADGKSWAVYKFNVDPGGMIPAFAADMGNKSGVSDVFRAVEKEAKRRTAERKSRLGK